MTVFVVLRPSDATAQAQRILAGGHGSTDSLEVLDELLRLALDRGVDLRVVRGSGHPGEPEIPLDAALALRECGEDLRPGGAVSDPDHREFVRDGAGP